MKTLNAILLGILLLCLPLPAISGTVVEYFNNDLHHFFYTADPAEQSWLDSLGGSPAGGWFRTTKKFKEGGVTPVCRFYGSQSPGPNSHFYTVDAGECDFLKQLQASTPATEKRWNFEGYAYSVYKPTNGICPAYTLPVYRAYNRGNVGGYDSNHRLATDIFDILAVVNLGWSYEGVVMCVPQ